MQAVRNGARLNAGTRPSTTQFADAEAQLELYVAAGFTPGEALNISIGIARYVVGFVLEEQDERDRTEDESGWGGGDPMTEVAPFPILSAALKPLLRTGTINTDGIFEGALAYMVEGIRASLPRGRRRRPAPGVQDVRRAKRSRPAPPRSR